MAKNYVIKFLKQNTINIKNLCLAGLRKSASGVLNILITSFRGYCASLKSHRRSVG